MHSLKFSNICCSIGDHIVDPYLSMDLVAALYVVSLRLLYLADESTLKSLQVVLSELSLRLFDLVQL